MSCHQSTITNGGYKEGIDLNIVREKIRVANGFENIDHKVEKYIQWDPRVVNELVMDYKVEKQIVIKLKDSRYNIEVWIHYVS